MRFHCCDLRRLDVLRRSGTANAIDFLEVLDRESPPGAPRQQTLFVRLLRPGFVLTPANLRITGGERIRTVGIVWCAAANALPPQAEPGLVATVDDLAHTLVIRTDSAGDFSVYTLSIVASSGTNDPPAGFDPKLSSIDFSFKVECPADFDCAGRPLCPPVVAPKPDIDYLAKDYQGFRRLMLDRLNLLVPGWTERSAADIGVMLVELLAYAADNLSYRQDAIANEAYLATARRRVSVRRHARLVDYFMHEGCNARAFIHFEVVGQAIALAQGTELLTRTPKLPPVVAPDSQARRDAISAGALVFETAHAAILDERLNRLSFYTWGDNGCCLTPGTISATLRGNLASVLHVGDILLFEEVVSPTTFVAADVDRSHRWAVRLTAVAVSQDPSGRLFEDPPVNAPVDVTEIAWDAADALPFPLCLSVQARPGLEVSVALGNIVLADQGLTVQNEALGSVPPETLQLVAPPSTDCCSKPDPVFVPPRFRPALKHAPLSHGFDIAGLLAVPISADEAWWPASSLLSIDPRAATPRIARLVGNLGTVSESWTARRDLLSSAADATDFVVEVENNGRARLRFGDDDHGKRPDSATAFVTTYRFGNGTAGNVGADAVAHIVSTSNGVFTAVRNPLAAAGGVDPEDIEVVRRDAPQAFRTQERAVTPADYAAAAERRPDVQRAAASFRWTGSWYTVFVTPDRYGGGSIDDTFKARLRRHLERFRMAGYDLEVSAPRYVPLEVGLHICVKDDYFRADVVHAVAAVLSSDVLSDGSLGLFHPDNFSFGQPVYLSRVIGAAQAVEGVDSVRADTFRRLGDRTFTSLQDDVIQIGDFEIAQLANNPNFPERGRLVLAGGGGK
ncbi:MAG: putative baseplate assembly protein [Proteobacteria bacterium]|nr:putative baseplate assembly protein [Pseudomonadota bacterium]